MFKLIIAFATLVAFSASATAGRLDADLFAADGAAQIDGQAYGDFATKPMVNVEQGQSAAEVADGRNKLLFGANSR